MENRQINYDAIAATYAQTRAAAPWVVDFLQQHITRLPAGATVMELGCGTGNHIRALAERLPHYHYAGFDQSAAMLAQARARTNAVQFSQGDAQEQWPYADHAVDLVYNVDVIHYIQDLNTFFSEAKRVLKPGGSLLIVTDSTEDLHNRSLTRFFPEILEYELARYPAAQALHEAAQHAGLHYLGSEAVQGTRPIDDAYIANLAAKCSSALRLISAEAHQAGLERVRQAQQQGQPWHSHYTIHDYTN
ncbi:MAG: methyltransferase domain-containing protein [Caldilineaceae bacterium]